MDVNVHRHFDKFARTRVHAHFQQTQIDTINDAIVNYRSVNNESDRIGKLFEAL